MNRNLVFTQESAYPLGETLNHLVLARHHGGQVQRNPAGFNAMFGKLSFGQMKIFAGIQQCLARDTADIEADAAETGLLFDAGDFEVELCSMNSRDVPARPGPIRSRARRTRAR